MNHIEFTGVAGVGKSSLRDRLIARNDDLYRGLHSRPMRIFPSPLQTVLDNVPSTFDQIFEKGFWKLTSPIYYNKFNQENPNYSTGIGGCVSIAEMEKSTISEMLKNTAEKYQYGIDTKQTSEILCLDEGFYHRGVSVGVRSGNYTEIGSYGIPPSSYFDSFPQPDILFHIKADTDVIQEQKQLRDGKKYQIERLKKDRNLVDQVSKEAQTRGVRVIQIKNNSNLTESVEKMERYVCL